MEFLLVSPSNTEHANSFSLEAKMGNSSSTVPIIINQDTDSSCTLPNNFWKILLFFLVEIAAIIATALCIWYFPAFSLFYSLLGVCIGLLFGIFNSWKNKWTMDAARVSVFLCLSIVASIFIGSFTIFIGFELWIGHFSATSVFVLTLLITILSLHKKKAQDATFDVFAASLLAFIVITSIVAAITIGLAFAQPSLFITGAESNGSLSYTVTLVVNQSYSLDVSTAQYWNCFRPTVQIEGLPSKYDFSSDDFWIEGTPEKTQTSTKCRISVICNHFVTIRMHTFYVHVIEPVVNQTLSSQPIKATSSGLQFSSLWISVSFLMISPFVAVLMSRAFSVLFEHTHKRSPVSHDPSEGSSLL